LSFSNLISSQSEPRIDETDKFIKITKNTVQFGSSIYQFKNVTGFKVGHLPKKKFPLFLVLFLGVGGLGLISYVGSWGLVFLLAAVAVAVFHLSKVQYYGLSLFLNSGQESFFVSSDKNFLHKVVLTLYEFMEEDRDGVVNIDMSNRSVTIGGDNHSPMNLGDHSTVSTM
jgi:hypothetical protein